MASKSSDGSRMDSDLTLLRSTEPMKTREETVRALEALLDGPRSQPMDVYGRGPLLVSDVPSNARPSSREDGATTLGAGVIIGIDEAGRGPVLGPMVYSAAYWSPDDSDAIPPGFNDSKQLDARTRERLFDTILRRAPQVGFVIRVLHASEISRNMLRRREPYNLNAMSHDAAIQMVRAVLDAGVEIDTCYVDTVGVADGYRHKLEREFSGRDIRFVVEKKADAKYAPCSAASVIAKVTRDAITKRWSWSERNFEPKDGGKDWGSGYPSDPKCKGWMEKNLVDPVFCYPDFVRFSWGTAKAALEGDGVVKVEWESDDDEEESGDGGRQMSLSSFVVGKQKPRKKPRLECFEKLGLTPVVSLVET